MIVIDVLGDDGEVVDRQPLEAEEQRIVRVREAYLEWLKRAPQPQVEPIQSLQNAK